LTAKWPVLHYGSVPKVDPYRPDWRLRIFGMVEDEYELGYDEIRKMPAIDVVCDMHCVTHWSRLNNTFTGVPTKAIIERAKPKPNARFVMCPFRSRLHHQRAAGRVHRRRLHPRLPVGR
jgi:DMSO/TMAO reductase YedYZ molybdopterin-dependent catalytic subunit